MGSHRGFYLHRGETNAVIRGLTIQKGYENSANGGGIEAVNSTVTVQDCILQCNTASSGGFFNVGTATLTNCTLTSNTAHVIGGGLYSDVPGGGSVFGLVGSGRERGFGQQRASLVGQRERHDVLVEPQ